MVKNIDKIKRDFIRLIATEQGIYLEVRDIRWIGPHEPEDNWLRVKEFKHDNILNSHTLHNPAEISLFNNVISIHEVDREVNKILKNRRFFQVCGRCRTLNPKGFMDDEFSCQDCAEKVEGVIY